MTQSGLLVLEDGRCFKGQRFGAHTDVGGEVVFNTSMIGYQEILGDPSYTGQMVVMTYPMIGNYGIAPDDFESPKVFLSALLVKEVSRIASNWRHEMTLDAYLAKQGIPGLCGFDTRALVRHLRDHGAMRGVIGDATTPIEVLVQRARAIPSMTGCDLAKEVTTKAAYEWTQTSDVLNTVDGVKSAPGRSFYVIAYDYGVKWNILRRLADVGCRVKVVPATTPAEDVLAENPDGVFLSNGPGDPEPATYAINNIKKLLGKVPVFGICLGHQLLALACGGKSYKLKFGHRGANHPVMDYTIGRVEITAQNHGFAIDPASLPKDIVEITHMNLNDQTVAGLRLRNVPAFSVQYHPEAAPGPHDSSHLFMRFAEMMQTFRDKKNGHSHTSTPSAGGQG